MSPALKFRFPAKQKTIALAATEYYSLRRSSFVLSLFLTSINSNIMRFKIYNLMIAALVLFTSQCFAQSPTFRYTYDVGLFDISGGMVQTPTGGFTVAGLNNSVGPYYGNVYNMDAQGNVQWAKAYNAGFASAFMDIKNVSTGGYIVTGQSTSGGGGAVLARLDATGNVLWSYRYQCPNIGSGNASSEYGNAVIEASDGGFVVAGGVDYFWDGVSGTTVDTTSALGFKVDASGNLLWARVWTISVPNPDEHYFNDVTESNGNYYFVGQSSEGTGTLSSNGDYPSNGLIVKTTTAGVFQYIRRFGGTNSQGFNAAITLTNGNILIGGFDADDGILMALDYTASTPTPVYNRRLDGSLFTSIYIIQDIMQTSDGNYSVIGTRLQFASIALQTMIVKLNSSTGALMFARSYAPIGLSGILPEGGLCSDQGYYISVTDQQMTGFHYNVIRTDATGQTAATPSGCPGSSFTPALASVSMTWTTPTYNQYTTLTGSSITLTVINQTVTPTQHCLNVPSVLSATSASTNVTCFGSCNGTATATPSGGTGPYTYAWAPSGGTAATATGLCPGTYTCTVTDAASATAQVTVTITQPAAALTGTITASSSVTCNALCNGSATVAASGGTSGYTYSWAPSGGTAASASGLCQGVYTVTITDANSCTTTRTVSITQPNAVTGTATSTPSSCSGNTGSATVTPSGGTGAYTYSWSPSGGTAATATNLAPGPYVVTITDANGCTGTANVTVSTNTGPTASLQSSGNVSCFGGSNGTATVSATGGNPGYTYSWAPSGGTSATASGLAAGNYTCTITDQSGCVTTQSVAITSPSALTATPSSTSSGCTNSGSATATPAGGAGSYTYVWSPSGGTSQTATPLAPGVYTCLVTDFNGCTTTVTATVTLGTPITVSATSSSSTICSGTTATINASGATNYSWQPGNLSGNSINVNPSATTTYTIIGTTGTNCADTITHVITVNPQPGLTVASLPSTICQGDSVTIGVTGASTYLWQPGNITDSAFVDFPASTTTYTVIGTNSNGCSDTTTVTVTVTGAPVITASTSADTICTGGSVTLTSSGAANYIWTPGNLSGSSVVVNPSANTTYTVIGSNGSCADTMTVDVAVTAGPTVSVTSGNASICPGSSATLTASGASAYVWSSGGTTATETVTPASTQTYTVTGTDANGCTATATYTVTVFTAPAVSISGSNSICIGDTVTLTASGATSYTWNTSATSTSISVNPSANTTYTVTGTDANGCTATATYSVTVNNPPVATVSGTSGICEGTGAILTASGGGTYTWSSGGSAAIENVNPTTTTTYTVTVSVGSCSDTATFTVVVFNGPTANAGADATINIGGNTILSGNGGGTYSWSPSTGLDNPNIQNPTATPTVTTVYVLTVVDSNGCSSMDTVIVTVTLDCGELFIPNIFSPNGDGHNDVLKVYGTPCVDDFTWQIFDRWGELVYESTDPAEEWDGTFKGKELDPAVFVYKLKGTFITGLEFERSGNVTLVK
jgi:gliding motility-associated-like protein